MSRNHPSRGMRKVQYVSLALLAVAVLVLVYLAQARVSASQPAAGATPNPVPTYATADPQTRAVFVGDSYTQGIGASSPDTEWTSLVSKHEGWQQINLGRGGTGYLVTSNANGCGLDYCPNYQEMVATAVNDRPDVLVFSGGQNDFNGYITDQGSVETAVTNTFRSAREQLPATRIIVVGPSTPDTLTQSFQDFSQYVNEAAESINAEFVDLANPNVIDPSVVLPDGGHVNDDGHAAIAARVTSTID